MPRHLVWSGSFTGSSSYCFFQLLCRLPLPLLSPCPCASLCLYSCPLMFFSLLQAVWSILKHIWLFIYLSIHLSVPLCRLLSLPLLPLYLHLSIHLSVPLRRLVSLPLLSLYLHQSIHRYVSESPLYFLISMFVCLSIALPLSTYLTVYLSLFLSTFHV